MLKLLALLLPCVSSVALPMSYLSPYPYQLATAASRSPFSQPPLHSRRPDAAARKPNNAAWRKKLSLSSSMTPAEVTLAGSTINVLLAGMKAAAGMATGSAALIADAGHSLSDLFSDAFALAAARVPRWEGPCTLGIALILASTGVGMIYSSGGVLLAAFRAPSLIVTGSASMLDGVGLIIALFSIASKEALFHLTHAVGMRCQSSTLVANAHHHRSDAMSSIAAACGIGGAIAGVQLLDPLAALVVGGMVLKLAVETAGGH